MNRLLQGDVEAEDSRESQSCHVCSLKRWEASSYDGSNGDWPERHKEACEVFFGLTNCPSNRRIKAAEKREVLEVASGTAQLIVGTHALIQGVHYQDLGLVIIDEQHRFGVSQRRRKDQNPDVLMMTEAAHSNEPRLFVP